MFFHKINYFPTKKKPLTISSANIVCASKDGHTVKLVYSNKYDTPCGTNFVGDLEVKRAGYVAIVHPEDPILPQIRSKIDEIDINYQCPDFNDMDYIESKMYAEDHDWQMADIKNPQELTVLPLDSGLVGVKGFYNRITFQQGGLDYQHLAVGVKRRYDPETGDMGWNLPELWEGSRWRVQAPE